MCCLGIGIPGLIWWLCQRGGSFCFLDMLCLLLHPDPGNVYVWEIFKGGGHVIHSFGTFFIVLILIGQRIVPMQ